jgi:hypothetical protein
MYASGPSSFPAAVVVRTHFHVGAVVRVGNHDAQVADETASMRRSFVGTTLEKTPSVFSRSKTDEKRGEIR